MKSRHLFAVLTIVIGVGVASTVSAQEVKSDSTSEIVRASEIKWQPLNPKRGKNGPQAGTLWGDQTKSGASGFLVKFVDGFSSPPHIHNITYRGVVISGSLYNGPTGVEPMWMPVGSYWTQPKGQPHITAARGVSVAYVEIHKGPYLVLPTDKAFDRGERPINADASNIVWLDALSSRWIQQPVKTAAADAVKIAFLWGKPQPDQLNGSLIRLPAGFKGTLRSHGKKLRAVVIEGDLEYQASESETKTLEPGSYFGGNVAAEHRFSASTSGSCIVYVHTDSNYEVVSQ